ncbi:MAG: CCA tRNA nucleotidyltransferase [Defluviitaleaceae bacterium]|nr:CCA tRNA nucleotidyltransferase [Defluviitaleaceae bacterium]
MFEIPKNVLSIISTLESAGHEAFIVGGCVRDVIRGVTPKDWDITTSAVPSQVKGLFSRTFDTGIKHGTVSVLLGGDCFEVTTYRVDGEYLDSRRPSEVTFAGEIEKDLSRRDFTVNAIAYSPTRGFVDPFDGQVDIKKGIIRCVGDAEKRFGEDALRMLRAIRFAAVLEFSVNNAALHAITKLRESLANISAERIREELVKLLCGKNLDALKLLEKTGLMYFVLQKRVNHGDLEESISRLKTLAKTNADENMKIALFLYWTGDNCKNILRDLRFDNKTIKTVSIYVENIFAELPQNRYEIKKFLKEISPEFFLNLIELKKVTNPALEIKKIHEEVHDILEKKECFTLRELAVNGDDLAAVGIPRGKETGEALEKLLDAVMREPSLNVKEKLLCL